MDFGVYERLSLLLRDPLFIVKTGFCGIAGSRKVNSCSTLAAVVADGASFMVNVLAPSKAVLRGEEESLEEVFAMLA